MTSLLQQEFRKLSARYGGSLTEPLQRFGAWWGEQLRDMLPPTVRNAWFGDSARLLVDAEGDGLVVSAEGADGTRELGRFPADSEAALDFDVPRRLSSVRLRLSAEKALTTHLELPLAATENLREAVSFQIDRQTPFTPDSVYFDCEVIDRDVENQSVTVALALVPRNFADGLLDTLARVGIEPDAISIRGAGENRYSAVNLLPASRRRSRGLRARRHVIALAVINVLLLAVAVTLPLLQKQHVIESLQPQVTAAIEAAKNGTQLRREVERLSAAGTYLRNKKNDRTHFMQVLDEVSRLLPAHTWVHRVDYDGDEIQVQGESSEASTLIRTLEASPLFEGVQFRSPVMRVGSTEFERFHLSASISPGGGQ